MFIAETFPLWGFLVAGVVAVLIFLIAFLDKEGIVPSILVGVASYLVACVILQIAILAVPVFGEETFSNPAQRPSLSLVASVDKDEMNAKIAETIGVNKVSADVGNGDSRTVKSMGQGDIFDFVAIDNGSKINGSFYFTDDTMEIIVEDAEQVKQEFSVSID